MIKQNVGTQKKKKKKKHNPGGKQNTNNRRVLKRVQNSSLQGVQ